MLLINCEICLILTCYANCVISNAATNQDKIFAVTDTKRYVPVVISSTQDWVAATIKARIQTHN